MLQASFCSVSTSRLCGRMVQCRRKVPVLLQCPMCIVYGFGTLFVGVCVTKLVWVDAWPGYNLLHQWWQQLPALKVNVGIPVGDFIPPSSGGLCAMSLHSLPLRVFHLTLCVMIISQVLGKKRWQAKDCAWFLHDTCKRCAL